MKTIPDSAARREHYWMKENLSVGRPYDGVVRSIIGASAKSNHVVAAANVIAREHLQRACGTLRVCWLQE
jgi:hypothetical protein